jgi:bifunctional ADP-heptose synthase (sugar kinase/adenylyltransferase)
MTGPFPADKLSLKVKALAYAKVLCFGDVMLDRFVEGSVSRISPESPTPVFKYERENLFPGGQPTWRAISARWAGCAR